MGFDVYFRAICPWEEYAVVENLLHCPMLTLPGTSGD